MDRYVAKAGIGRFGYGVERTDTGWLVYQTDSREAAERMAHQMNLIDRLPLRQDAVEDHLEEQASRHRGGDR